MRQIPFQFMKNYKKEFGGSLLAGKRKTKRPLSTKHAIHVVLRSNRNFAFSPRNSSLRKLLHAQARKFNVRVYAHALNWSHIHVVIKIKDRKNYLGFIRSFTAILSLRLRQSGFCKQDQPSQIFELRPYTRILEWGRDFQNTLRYQIINQMEATGLLIRPKLNKPSRRRTVKFSSRPKTTYRLISESIK